MKNTVACSTIATRASSSSSEIWRAAKVIMSGLMDAGATTLSIFKRFQFAETQTQNLRAQLQILS